MDSAPAGILLFTAGGDRYAMDLEPIEAILPNRPVSAIPCQPVFLEGFFEEKGECFPLVSLQRLLGVAKPSSSLPEKILVLRAQGIGFAIRVDSVQGTRDRAEESVLRLELKDLLDSLGREAGR